MNVLAYFDTLLKNNGPEVDDVQTIMQAIEKLDSHEVSAFQQLMQSILDPSTIIGHSFTKPLGYSGDYLIIEKIYRQYVSPDPKATKWDAFIHNLPSAIAVRNRKDFACRILKEYNDKDVGRIKKVLILGSGPVTEVFEYLVKTPDNHLHFDLIDMDQRAIDYAKEKNKDYLDAMEFFCCNVLRYTPTASYDLIWSAGLFDYFRDRHFVFLITRLYQYLLPKGEMIIGNFSSDNPSKKIMEVLADWYLFHRSEQELIQFAQRGGVPDHKISIMKEPLGVNLFLRVKK